MAKRNELRTILLVGTLVAAATAHALPVEVLTDGGFEAGTPSPSWSEASTNFGTPICSIAICGSGGGSGPRSGTYWVWLGGIDAAETAFVSQTVTIPTASIATLEFWLAIPVADNVGTDTFQVTLDDVLLLSRNNFDPLANLPGYVLNSIDVSSFADGGMHTLKFQGTFTSQGNGVTNFFVDDASLSVPEPGSLSLLAFGLVVLAHQGRRGPSFRLRS